jgi:hypothetical protein
MAIEMFSMIFPAICGYERPTNWRRAGPANEVKASKEALLTV